MPEEHKESEEAESRRHSIDSIESLQLPRRKGRRRGLLPGEKIYCHIRSGEGEEISAEVSDLSSGGIAVLKKADGPVMLSGQPVSLTFAKGEDDEFQIPGFISDVSELAFPEEERRRVGIRFSMKLCHSEEDYHTVVGERIFPFHGQIRPQASCKDPFFFQEIILFDVSGCSANGLDLIVSARCKTLLPGQVLELDLFLPGRGRFLTSVIISDIRLKLKDQRSRIFARFRLPDPTMSAAISEHLIMVSSGLLPDQLRSQGFHVGDLSFAFEISHHLLDDDIRNKEQLFPGALSPPDAFSESRDQRETYKIRQISCKLGSSVVAVLSLVFCTPSSSDMSVFQKAGYSIPDEIQQHTYLELTDLYLSRNIRLADILFPLLRHLSRIVLQSSGRYLLLECSPALRPTLEKIGFRCEGPVQSRQSASGQQAFHLMSLNVRSALLNSKNILPDRIWRLVYQDLYRFFKKQMERLRKSGHIR